MVLNTLDRVALDREIYHREALRKTLASSSLRSARPPVCRNYCKSSGTSKGISANVGTSEFSA
jgi:hypothetical protein